MAKRTLWLVVLMLVLAVIAIACVIFALRDNNLAGSGVYFVRSGGSA